MDQDLFLLLIALVISAIGQVNLFSTVTVVEVTYELIRLLWIAYKSAFRNHTKVKSPSSSAKQNGRLRKRN